LSDPSKPGVRDQEEEKDTYKKGMERRRERERERERRERGVLGNDPLELGDANRRVAV